MREGLKGISRAGSGAPIASGLKKSRGLFKVLSSFVGVPTVSTRRGWGRVPSKVWAASAQGEP